MKVRELLRAERIHPDRVLGTELGDVPMMNQIHVEASIGTEGVEIRITIPPGVERNEERDLWGL